MCCRLGNSIRLRSQNRFAALENLNDCNDINRAWENIKENIKSPAKDSRGLYELKKHKSWFNEEYRWPLHQRKWAKMQWLQIKAM